MLFSGCHFVSRADRGHGLSISNNVYHSHAPHPAAQPLVDPILAGASLRFMTGGQTTTISFGFSCNVRACCLTLPRDAADLALYPCLQASLGSEPQTPARIEAVMVNQRKVFPELTQTLQFRLSLTNIGYGMHTVVELQCAVDASASIPRRFQIVLIQV